MLPSRRLAAAVLASPAFLLDKEVIKQLMRRSLTSVFELAVRACASVSREVLLVTAPANAHTPVGDEPRTGGTPRYGWPAEPTTLNQFFTSAQSPKYLADLSLDQCRPGMNSSARYKGSGAVHQSFGGVGMLASRRVAYGLAGLIALVAAVAGPAPSTAALEPTLALTTGASGSTTAASISYQPIPRPSNAPDSFTAPAGASLQFYSITTIDGVTTVAAIVSPQGSQPKDTTMVIHVHGSGGNLYEVTGAQLAIQLVQHGYANMTINTRQHDDGINMDNFFDVRNDIYAATSVARSMGYQRIVVHGHSLGTSQVLYYAATDWSPDIKGIVLTGPFADLPWKSQLIVVNNEPVYRQLYQEALDAVHSGHPDAVLPDPMPYLGGTTTPVTAQHFLTYRWQYESAAVSTDWIRRVTVPILLVRDGQDQTVLSFEPVWLCASATSYGALSQDIENDVVQDSSSGNGHNFPNTIPQLTDLVLSWLQKRGL